MALTEAQKRANQKYNAKAYDQIKIVVPKGNREIFKEAAAAAGESLNAYVIGAVVNRMKAEGRSELLVKSTSETEETTE